MGSPLSADISNAFLSIIEKEKISNDCGPKIYMRYVDDTLAVFDSIEHEEKFFKYINTWDQKIEFTRERYNEKGLSFLDINLKKEGNRIGSEVFHKETDTDLIMQFDSNIPMKYKRGLIGCLVIRALRICSNWTKITKEFQLLKEKLVSNGFPIGMVENEIRKVVDRWNNNKIGKKEKADKSNVKEVILKLPYEGKSTEIFGKKVKSIFEKTWSGSVVKVVLKPVNKIRSFISNTSNVPKGLESDVVYIYTCQDCQETYIGETIRHCNIRFSEHKNVSWKTGKNMKIFNTTSIKNHELQTNHIVNMNNFDILARNRSNRWIGRKILESLMIKERKPKMNGQQCFELLVV